MKRELFIAPSAAAELDSAAAWYDKRRTGLGAEFLLESNVLTNY